MNTTQERSVECVDAGAAGAATAAGERVGRRGGGAGGVVERTDPPVRAVGVPLCGRTSRTARMSTSRRNRPVGVGHGMCRRAGGGGARAAGAWRAGGRGDRGDLGDQRRAAGAARAAVTGARRRAAVVLAGAARTEAVQVVANMAIGVLQGGGGGERRGENRWRPPGSAGGGVSAAVVDGAGARAHRVHDAPVRAGRGGGAAGLGPPRRWW